jgi:hypothetical protein
MIKNLGRTLLDERDNLFRLYWGHRLGVSDGEVQGYQLQDPEHHVGVPVY